MLLSLSITNFTLVEHLEIDFVSGMTVITGETGAGKSLILDALAMALGDRADTDRIRQGKDRLEVSACFDLLKAPEALEWLEQQDFELDDNECLMRRIINREGRSKGYINGNSATMQQLRVLGEMLLDIHSQHEHQSLLRKDTHQLLLDNYSGTQPLVKTVQSRFKAWQQARDQLQNLASQSDARNEKKELLSFQVREFNQLNLGENELVALEAEHHLLANAENVLHDSHTVLELCQGNSEFNLQQGLNQALQLLNNLSPKPKALEDAERALSSANIEVTEASREIQRHIDSFEINPERLSWLDERLASIHDLARKHRVPADALYDKIITLRAELDHLSGDDESIAMLSNKVDVLAGEYLESANQLSSLRKSKASSFANAVNKQLTQLNMAGAKLTVKLTPNAKDSFSAKGLESVEFLINTNQGQPSGSLAKIASGGELSRISLAIQVIAAQHSAIPTLLFDEVDVGIGGATAGVVGRLLRGLGAQGQVVCITHQPQVASCGHTHLLAEKFTSKSGAIESRLIALDNPQRTHEIARMLGGMQITEKTLDHAKEMMELEASN